MKVYVAWGVAFLALAAACVAYLQTPKIGYVRSEYLLSEFAGTKEAQAAYQQKTEAWQANIDTLRIELQRFKAGVDPTNPNAVEEYHNKEQQLFQYITAIEQKAEQEDEQMMQAVLNQVNSFVEGWGKEQGYDLILGTTGSGSLLYGRDEADITEELVKALNKGYHGK